MSSLGTVVIAAGGTGGHIYPAMATLPGSTFRAFAAKALKAC